MQAWGRGTWSIAVLLAVAFITPLHNATAKPIVTAVRIGEYPSKTRFVVAVSERVQFHAFTLAKPYRVVVDLPEVDWQLSNYAPRKGGLITDLRYGLFTDGKSRVVLDIAAPAKVAKSFRLEPRGGKGYRLVIDIERLDASKLQIDERSRSVTGIAPVGVPAPMAKPIRPAGAKKLIAIDPGHGGVDPGAIGISGIREKAITLAQAHQLKRRLEATGRFRVVLTRNRDVFIRLRKRIEIARRTGANLFISLHADSISNPKIRGASIYTLSERASDKEAAALAAKENKADMISGVDLAVQNREVAIILINLAQRNSKNESAIFAKILTRELRSEMKLLGRTHRFAGFAVLKSPDIPSVLVELGYLSNRADERNLRRAKHRDKVAQAIVRAVANYFSRKQAFNRP